MFKTRLISGVILVALAIVLIVTGGNVLLISTALISLIGMFELYRVFQVEKKALGVIGYLAAIIYYLNLKFQFVADAYVILMGFLTVLMIVFVLSYPKYRVDSLLAVFFGLFYVAVMLGCVYQIRSMERGAFIAFLIFSCSWGCDTFAYCVGKLWGKFFGNHKMSPVLSPKKSIEGAIGGVLGSALLTFVFCFICREQMNLDTRALCMITIIGAIAAVVSMIGDLMASAIKRAYDIKDYGKLIPGHGGILDRFDSMIIVAPIIYHLANYLV